MPERYSARVQQIANLAILVSKGPTRKEAKLCAALVRRTVTLLRTLTAPAIIGGIVARTPDELTDAAQVVLGNCAHCGWCKAHGIKPKPRRE